MKKILILLFLVASFFTVKAQSDMLNVGVGIGNGSFGIYSGSRGLRGYNSRITLPTIGLSYEHWIRDAITLGGYVSFNRTVYRNRDFNYYKNSYNNMWFGVRGAYYFDDLIGMSTDFDLYAGAALGFVYSTNRQISQFDDPVLRSNGLYGVAGLFIGGRYHIAESVSLYSELGIVASWITIGATFML